MHVGQRYVPGGRVLVPDTQYRVPSFGWGVILFVFRRGALAFACAPGIEQIRVSLVPITPSE